MKKLNYLIGFTVIAGLISLQAYGAENSAQEVYDLGEIVISAEGKGVETIGTVREVTAEDIEMSGAETLDDALNLLPGIMVRTGGQGIPRPDLRGMKPRHVTLLINGIPFNSAGDGQFDPSLISTENIAKIKVSYGNDSVLYGPGGLGGVINVVTKKGTDKTKFSVEGKYAQKDDKTIKASLSGAGGLFSYFISASDYRSDGYELSDDFIPTSDEDGIIEDGGIRDNSDRELQNFFGNLTLIPNDKFQVGLILNYINGEQGTPPITISRDADRDFGKSLKYIRIDDKDGLSLSLSGSYDADGPLSFRGWVFMNDYEEVINGYDDNTYTTQENRNSYSAKENTSIKGINLQTQYMFDNKGKASFSLGTKQDDFDSEGWEVGRNDTTTFDESHEIKTHTLAAEYEMEILENMGFVAGYGYSWFKKENSNSDNADNYLIGLNYNFTENSRIKASIADKVRFPSVTQLYGVDEGNPDLTYEKSMNYEIGFEHNMSNSRTAFSITGFRRDVENYISKVEIDGEDINMNNEEYQFQGIEITARNRSVKNLDLRLAYTYMDTEDKSEGSLVDEVQYNPEHKLALEGIYEFANGISAYASIERYENQYYYSSDNTLKGKLPDYTIVNLKIDKTFFSKALKVYVGANNLFDENYFESFALPREGRSIYGGLKYTF